MKLNKYMLRLTLLLAVIFVNIYPLALVLNIDYVFYYGIIWMLSIVMIIFICHNGYGGIVDRHLSSKYWIPVSKIALSIYLVTPCIQSLIITMRTNPIESFDIPDVVRSSIYY